MPIKVDEVKFINRNRQLPSYFTIFADFESNPETARRPDRNNSNMSYTDKYKNIFLAVMSIRLYALVVYSVNQCNYIEVEVLLIIYWSNARRIEILQRNYEKVF